MANIIIKGQTSFGKNRSEQEENMRKEWGSTMTDEQLDKLKHLERKNKEVTGSDTSFYRGNDIDQVK